MLISSRVSCVLALIALGCAFKVLTTSPDVSPAMPPDVKSFSQTETTTVPGIVVDAQGLPVARARVWMDVQTELGSRGGRTLLAKAETDDKGEFTLFLRCNAVAHYIDLRATVHSQDGLIGWWNDPFDRIPRSLKLTLRNVMSFSGKVSSSAGQPLQGVRLTPRTVEFQNDIFEDFHHLPSELRADLTVSTDALGQFTFEKIPEALSLFFDINAEAHGTFGAMAQLAQPISIRLSPLGRLTGKLQWIETSRSSKVPPTQVSLFDRLCCPDMPEPGSVLLRFNGYTPTKADGSFDFSNVPAGDYRLRVISDQGLAGPKDVMVSVSEQVVVIHVVIPIHTTRQQTKPVRRLPDHTPSVFDARIE